MAERRVAITGASGLVGSRLSPALTALGWQVIPISRDPHATGGVVHWDPARGQIDDAALDGVDAVIHLAGVSIAGKRWSNERKQEIHDSRIQGTQLLATTLANLPHPPAVLISTSAVGFYGDGGSTILTEQSAQGAGFLAAVCGEWETAAQLAADACIRVVHPRFGVVMAREGGMLPKVAQPFRFGAGGPIAGGRQYQSWIDIDDLVRVLLFLLDNDELAGPVNAVAPEPVTNAEFTRALSSTLHRPAFVPVPAFGIDLMMGEMGKELILVSQRAVPARLQEAGFEFDYPTIGTSLDHQLGGGQTTGDRVNRPLQPVQAATTTSAAEWGER